MGGERKSEAGTGKRGNAVGRGTLAVGGMDVDIELKVWAEG